MSQFNVKVNGKDQMPVFKFLKSRCPATNKEFMPLYKLKYKPFHEDDIRCDTSCRYLRCRCGYYCRYLYKCHFQVGFWEIFDQQARSTGDKIWFFGKARGHGGRHWKTAALSLISISMPLSCDTRLFWKPGKYGTEDCFNLQYFHYHINFNWSFRGCITRQNVCYFFSA